MQLRWITRSLLFSSALLVISSLSPLSTQADEQQPKGATEEQQPKGNLVLPPRDRFGDVSPGAAEDTLKACLARIPEQATVGQRMMAELTCEREEQIKKTYQGLRWF
ncbi:MAG: hypothetical protein K0S58_1150 [Nitrospira sp.]|nr:hypothetical protein [Nitrospira sp.]